MKMLSSPIMILLSITMLGIVYAAFIFGPARCLDQDFHMNWPHVLAAMFWISTFSGGLMGVLYHGRRLLFKSKSGLVDYSRLATLSNDEMKILQMWVQGKLLEFRGKPLLPRRFA